MASKQQPGYAAVVDESTEEPDSKGDASAPLEAGTPRFSTALQGMGDLLYQLTSDGLTQAVCTSKLCCGEITEVRSSTHFAVPRMRMVTASPCSPQNSSINFYAGVVTIVQERTEQCCSPCTFCGFNPCMSYFASSSYALPRCKHHSPVCVGVHTRVARAGNHVCLLELQTISPLRRLTKAAGGRRIVAATNA